MGIILNDGVRRPGRALERLRFGAGTPYHTVLEPVPVEGERVVRPEVARAARRVLAEVVEEGTGRRVRDAFCGPEGEPVLVGGKTGSGDNRYETFARGGALLSSRPVSRTAAFAFFIGERYYGVVTASVEGEEAASYRFTSALPLQVLKCLAPAINRRLGCPEPDKPALVRALYGPASSPAAEASRPS
jgi:membrane peptidoglycan carboxypeptidase